MRGVELNRRMHAASSPVTPSDRMSCLPQPARYKCSEMSVAKSTRLQQAPHMQLGNRRPLRAGAAHLLDFLSLRLVLGFGFLVYRLLWRHAGPLLGCAARGWPRVVRADQQTLAWTLRALWKAGNDIYMPRLVSRPPKSASYAVRGCTAGPPPQSLQRCNASHLPSGATCALRPGTTPHKSTLTATRLPGSTTGAVRLDSMHRRARDAGLLI